MSRNAAGFIFFAHHEAADIVKEQEWDVPLAAKFDEISRLLCTLRKEHAVVHDYTNRIAAYCGSTADNGRSKTLAEFRESTAIEKPGENVASRQWLAWIGADQAGNLRRIVMGQFRAKRRCRKRPRTVAAHDTANDT